MVLPDSAVLREVANATMPFGKYKGRRLLELPDAYLAWFKRQGFPRGKLGMLMESALEIRLNGLEHLLRPLIEADPVKSGHDGRASVARRLAR